MSKTTCLASPLQKLPTLPLMVTQRDRLTEEGGKPSPLGFEPLAFPAGNSRNQVEFDDDP